MVILLLVILLAGSPVYGQSSGDSVTVTFVANTAGVPDLIGEHSTVQIRGGHADLGYWTIESPVIMSSVGGDYWEAHVTFARPDLNSPIEYKYATNRLPFHVIEGNWFGWEAGANRQLDLAGFTGTDTTLPIEYVRGWENSASEIALFENTDSIEIFFRVNMELEIKEGRFIEGFEKIGIKGFREDGITIPGLSLIETNFLNMETNHANGSMSSVDYQGKNFYSKVIRVPASWAGRGVNFKFVKFNILTQSEVWEDLYDNEAYRSFTLPLESDTTISWSRWENRPLIEPGSLINVSEYGDDYFADGSLEYPFYNINWAYLNAADGDTIRIAPGIYYQNVGLSGKNVFLTSDYHFTNNKNTINATIIDGDFNGPALTIEKGSGSTTVKGLTLKNGVNDIGGGIWIRNANVYLTNLVITGNESTLGGGVLIEDSPETIIGQVRIEQNTAEDGGGLYSSGSIVNIFDSEITGNSSQRGGGIIAIDSSNLVLSNVKITGNVADSPGSAGGGLFGINSNIILDSVTVEENQAVNGWAGGILFSNNGITVPHYLNVSNSRIFQNNANSVAGIDIWNRSDDSSPLSFTFVNTEIIQNNAIGNYGGFYAGGPGVTGSIDTCRIDSNNSGGYASGLTVLDRASVMVDRSIIFGNQSFKDQPNQGSGSGVYVSQNSDIKIKSSNIVNNSGAVVNGVLVEEARAEITNSLITHNEGVQIGTTGLSPILQIAYSGLFPEEDIFQISSLPIDTSHIVLLDPLYIDREAGDLHLSFNSPMADKGDPDMDGDQITWENDPDDQDPDGSRLDIGRYPLYGSAVDVQLTITPTDSSLISPFDSVSVNFDYVVNQEQLNNLVFMLNQDGDTVDVSYSSSQDLLVLKPWVPLPTGDSIFIHFEPGLMTSNGSLVKYNGLPGFVKYGFNVARPGDLDLNGLIDINDFSIFSSDWGVSPGSFSELYPFAGNLDSGQISIMPDSLINYDDLIVFLYLWNQETNDNQQTEEQGSLNEFHSSYFDMKIDNRGMLVFSPREEIKAVEFQFEAEQSLVIEMLDMNTDQALVRQKINIERNSSVFSKASAGSGISLKEVNFEIKSGNNAQGAIDLTVNGVLANGERFIEKGLLNQVFDQLPDAFILGQNYPNPFNPVTTIPFSIPEVSLVHVSIYDLNGRLVNTLIQKEFQPGHYKAVWNGTNAAGQNAAAGVYICRMRAKGIERTVKLLLLK